MTINTVVMNAPAGQGGLITGMPSGTQYFVPSSGQVTVQAPDISAFLALGFTQAPNTPTNVGTPATHVTAVEYGDPYNHTSILTVAGAVLPAIAGGAALGVGVLLYTLPAGAQVISSTQMNLSITQTQGNINTDTPNVGIGTTIATGAVSSLSGTAAFMNLVTQQTAADCNGTKTKKTTAATASPFVLVTEAAGSKAIYFNAANTWAASGDAGALVNGTLTLNWKQMFS